MFKPKSKKLIKMKKSVYCHIITLACLVSNGFQITEAKRYEPTWESLDTRPLPSWYDNAKIGIFLHWGVYSVPSFGSGGNAASEWFWAYWKGGYPEQTAFMKNSYPPKFTYQDFAKDFTAEFYNPVAWAKLFQKSGAKYVVLTSKHHEGYTLWPSTYTFGWNAQDSGPHQDLLGKLAEAIRQNTDLKFGLYYSLYEWFNPMYNLDRKTNFHNNTFVTNKLKPEMLELVNKYHPEVVWADGDWDTSDTYWQSTEFLAWLYNDSPVKHTVVVNDRWGKGIPCHHGDFYTCSDRFNPGVLQSHKWENAMTIDKLSWGYRRNANLEDYLTNEKIIATIVETVSCGGNIAMNVGPTRDGRIASIFQERLLNVGQWLSINGEAIYGSKPWLFQNDTISKTWYTSKESAVYGITLRWPERNVLTLGLVTNLFKKRDTSVTLLGYSTKLLWDISNNTVNIHFPEKSSVSSKWAWVVKFERSRINNFI